MTRIKRFLPALFLAALLLFAAAPPALALDLDPADYFQLTYDPIAFDRSAVVPGEAFHTTITGQAVCYKTIPLPISRAAITSRVVARDAAGNTYTLNPGFTIEIDPFPDRAGEAYDIDVPVTMFFPPQAPPGSYEVVWQPVEARARISFVWTDVTETVPPEQAMGAMTVTAGQPVAPPVTTTTTINDVPASTGLDVFLFVVILAGAFVVASIVAIVLALLRRR